MKLESSIPRCGAWFWWVALLDLLILLGVFWYQRPLLAKQHEAQAAMAYSPFNPQASVLALRIEDHGVPVYFLGNKRLKNPERLDRELSKQSLELIREARPLPLIVVQVPRDWSDEEKNELMQQITRKGFDCWLDQRYLP